MRIPSVAIIGAGPVGLSASNALTKAGFKVTLFEAGNVDSECSHLSKDNYIFLTDSKIPTGVHRVGGGSNYWHRRIGEFLPLDFKNFIDECDSEFPITIDELKHFYVQAFQELGEDVRSDDEILITNYNHLARSLPENLDFRLIRYSRPEYFVNLVSKLKLQKNFELITSTKCIEIQSLPSKGHLSFGYNLKLERDGELFDFGAEIVLVACGAMNSPILIANSPSIDTALDANVIGTGLMEHFDGTVGTLRWNRGVHSDLVPKLVLNSQRKLPGRNEGLGLKISESLRESSKDINLHIEILKPPLSRKVVRGEGLEKILWLVFIWLEKLIKSPSRIFIKLLGDFSGSRTYSVWVKAEELPNIASSISASSDEFGFHKTMYDHKVSFESRKQFLKALIKLQTELSMNSIADFVIDAEVMNGESSIFRAINWHPMGTLRMGKSPSNSICDPDLKIFGTEGVYVIDASVFPRGSNGNPTFTAIALTLRLAEKLKSDFITAGNDKETP